MREEERRIDAGSVQLQARLTRPEAAVHGAGAPGGLVVIAHPMPTMGGSMDNNVVLALRDAALEAVHSALRVNFRGVGGSNGRVAGDARDARDLGCLLGAVSGWPEARGGLVAAGYSFGAWALCHALAEPELAEPELATPDLSGLLLVAPPVDILDFPPAGLHSMVPMLVIAGGQDSFCSSPSLEAWIEGMSLSPGDLTSVTLEGADHFMGGFEAEITDRASQWLRARLEPTQSSEAVSREGHDS